jgi:hypothetical protein
MCMFLYGGARGETKLVAITPMGTEKRCTRTMFTIPPHVHLSRRCVSVSECRVDPISESPASGESQCYSRERCEYWSQKAGKVLLAVVVFGACTQAFRSPVQDSDGTCLSSGGTASWFGSHGEARRARGCCACPEGWDAPPSHPEVFRSLICCRLLLPPLHPRLQGSL